MPNLKTIIAIIISCLLLVIVFLVVKRRKKNKIENTSGSSSLIVISEDNPLTMIDYIKNRITVIFNALFIYKRNDNKSIITPYLTEKALKKFKKYKFSDFMVEGLTSLNKFTFDHTGVKKEKFYDIEILKYDSNKSIMLVKMTFISKEKMQEHLSDAEEDIKDKILTISEKTLFYRLYYNNEAWLLDNFGESLSKVKRG